MNCPACHEPLAVLEHELVEIDYCATCGGVWLDAAELELLFTDPHRSERFLSGGQFRGPDPKRRCPRCRRHMQCRLTRGDRPVTYDRCPKGHGLWLDRGELHAVLDGAGPADGEVARHLREVFPAQNVTP